MNGFQISFLCILVAIIAYIVTFGVKYFSPGLGLLSSPNDRSSHFSITPHGGGVSIVIAFSLSLWFLYLFNGIDMEHLVLYGGFGILIALLGLGGLMLRRRRRSV